MLRKGFLVFGHLGGFIIPLNPNIVVLKTAVYSYFEKGCRQKCTRQSRKALWVVLSLLFFKEI